MTEQMKLYGLLILLMFILQSMMNHAQEGSGMSTDSPVAINLDFIVTDVAVDGATLYFTDPTNNKLYEMNETGEIIEYGSLLTLSTVLI